MSDRSLDKDFLAVADRLAAAGSIVVVSHVRPDGDALGSAVALARAATAAGKSATVIVPADPPWRYAFLLDGVPTAAPGGLAELASSADCLAVVDTSSFRQLEDVQEPLRRWRDKVVVIDHHLTGDDVGAVPWTDPSAAAAGVMLSELISQLGWPIDARSAEALTAAILTDTGWLKFANTDARALETVARLVAGGASLNELYRRLFQTDRRQRLALKARALGSLELHCRSRLAVMSLRRADFTETGADQAETDGLVNEAMNLASVEIAVMLVETPETVRASLRSKLDVDVARIAGLFGGGGHARAAGCSRAGTMADFSKELIAACAGQLAGKQ